MNEQPTTTHTIDAAGQSVGRVATRAAVLLSGKHLPTYAKNLVANVRVRIVNAGKISVPERKRAAKTYERYSGYPGGFARRSMKEIAEGKGYREVLRLAIRGMLPRNTLRARRIKNVTIEE